MNWSDVLYQIGMVVMLGMIMILFIGAVTESYHRDMRRRK
jgi:hypothetical protein